jgi:pyruvate dehydrogenase E1 component
MSVLPTCAAYDPAYAYEIGIIVQDGLRRMYQEREDLFYYLTVYNENYPQPTMPEGVGEGILKGLYRYRTAPSGVAVAQLFGSGPILNEALRAQQILQERYQVPTDVWSVTSYSELRRDALAVDRWNWLHPAEPERRPYLQAALSDAQGPIVAASDYMKAVAGQIAPWLPGRLVSLGTDGFGRSENREHLRKFFEVNAACIAAATLSRLSREGQFSPQRARQALADLGVDPEAANPARA